MPERKRQNRERTIKRTIIKLTRINIYMRVSIDVFVCKKGKKRKKVPDNSIYTLPYLFPEQNSSIQHIIVACPAPKRLFTNSSLYNVVSRDHRIKLHIELPVVKLWSGVSN